MNGLTKFLSLCLKFDLINPTSIRSSLPLLCTRMLCRGSLPAHQGKAPARRKQHLHYHLARNFQSLIFQYVFLSRLMGHYTKVLTFLSKNIVFTKKLLICKKSSPGFWEGNMIHQSSPNLKGRAGLEGSGALPECWCWMDLEGREFIFPFLLHFL